MVFLTHDTKHNVVSIADMVIDHLMSGTHSQSDLLVKLFPDAELKYRYANKPSESVLNGRHMTDNMVLKYRSSVYNRYGGTVNGKTVYTPGSTCNVYVTASLNHKFNDLPAAIRTFLGVRFWFTIDNNVELNEHNFANMMHTSTNAVVCTFSRLQNIFKMMKTIENDLN